jgi:hypothetical protein
MYQSSVPGAEMIELCPVPRMPRAGSLARIVPRAVNGPEGVLPVAYPTR